MQKIYTFTKRVKNIFITPIIIRTFHLHYNKHKTLNWFSFSNVNVLMDRYRAKSGEVHYKEILDGKFRENRLIYEV